MRECFNYMPDAEMTLRVEHAIVTLKKKQFLVFLY
jgi:hypothetical protein